MYLLNGVGNYDASSKTDYNSAPRYKKFGIDCCIEEPQKSMNDFFKLFQEVDFGSLTAATVSYNLYETLFTANQLSLQPDIYWRHVLH